MGSTDELIERLSGNLAPVRRLWAPGLRALAWVVLAVLVVTLFVWMRVMRHDLHARMGEPFWWLQFGAALLTGATATLACFEAGLPDRSRAWLWLPLPGVLLWFAGFGYGCLADWVAIPAGAPIEADSISCLETLIGTSIPLGLVIWLVLRRTKPLHAASAAWLAGLAVAGFADSAHLLINMVNPSALILVINILPSAGIAAAIAAMTRKAGVA